MPTSHVDVPSGVEVTTQAGQPTDSMGMESPTSVTVWAVGFIFGQISSAIPRASDVADLLRVMKRVGANGSGIIGTSWRAVKWTTALLIGDPFSSIRVSSK